MDRIGNTSSSPVNQSYDPNTCEAPNEPAPTQAPASCEDGSVSDDGVCASAGLKGPPTASERYVASLTAASEQAGADSPEQTTRAVQQLVEETSSAVLDKVRSAVADGSIKAGTKVDYEAGLPNGTKAKFSVSGAMEEDAEGKPELVAKVSGGATGNFGAVSASAAVSFSHSTSGRETLSLGACLFGGVRQEAADLAKLQLQAGVCATWKDSTDAAMTFEVDAVARASAGMKLGGNFEWVRDVEVRTPLSKEQLDYDLLR